jgi:NADPH-dependent curcumin reductase CurA
MQRGWVVFDTYLPAIKIGEVIRSIGAGRIVASNNPDFAVGDVVSGLTGWQDYVAMNPKGQFSKLFVSFIFRWVWHFLVSSVSSGYLPLLLRPEPKVRACC